ncbi:hypothetical protein A3C29_06565 [Candidatus Daviesbacteria bacterium RIFCSPHIGHO2_02_FULL_40_16]|nr:MAG: hypothetical protein A3C29_06565 [Candidatus Daviesbacteria bacterium RIFCSPHIGHO2_02_FULL_40_16]
MQKPPFDEVVKNYIRLVYFFARKSLYQQEDVDDIVQETFLKAMNNYKQFTFKSEDELKSWLLTICRHLIADQMRSKKKTISIEQNNIELFDNSDVEDMMNAEITHEKDIESVKKELVKLKAEEQEIIRLRIVEEMEFKEIAVALDTKEAAVKMRFYRAIIKLKEALV